MEVGGISNSNTKYQVILIDPPWNYKRTVGKGIAKDEYNILSDQEVLDLTLVSSLADDKCCALLLWVTGPKMDVGIQALQKWGFQYKTVFFTWVKTTKNGKPVCGLGHYTRSSTEFCLLATRGNVLQHKKSSSIPQLIISERREHSRKPPEAKSLILSFFGSDLRKIELFSRESTEGWDVWGNETDKFCQNENN